MSQTNQRNCFHSFCIIDRKCKLCHMPYRDWVAQQKNNGIPLWVQCRHEWSPDQQRCLHCNDLYSHIKKDHHRVSENPTKTLKFCGFCGDKIVNNFCKFCSHYWGDSPPEEVELNPLVKVFRATINRCAAHIKAIQERCDHRWDEWKESPSGRYRNCLKCTKYESENYIQ
jgi:hypothetical protein